MNTRKILYLLAIAAMMLSATSCSQEEDPTAGKVKVTFIAHLPETLSQDSRAIGDGTKANELFFWVFDENNQEVLGMRQHNIAFDKNSNTASVSAYLTPGHVYNFSFWAQRKDIDCYDPLTSSQVNMYYWDLYCNDDTRDAFWGWIPNLYVDEAGEITRDIVLVRRLAQVNVGITTEAYNSAKAAGIDLADYDSELQIKSSSDQPITYSAFSVREGAPYTTNNQYKEYDVDFMPYESPILVEPLRVGSDKYYYLAMSYFQPEVAVPTLGNVTLILHHKVTGKTLTYEFPNASFQGNKRTNLILRGITEKVGFEVVIDENFDNLEYNYDENGNPLSGNGNGGNNGN